MMLRIIGALALAVLSAPAAAQNADLDTAAQMADAPYHGERDGIYIGRFVIIPVEGGKLLLDGKTGCAWRREDKPSQFTGQYWYFEFPSGAASTCESVLYDLRRP